MSSGDDFSFDDSLPVQLLSWFLAKRSDLQHAMFMHLFEGKLHLAPFDAKDVHNALDIATGRRSFHKRVAIIRRRSIVLDRHRNMGHRIWYVLHSVFNLQAYEIFLQLNNILPRMSLEQT